MTHRKLIAVFAANVCRRFFKYLFWYFWSSAMEPLSACILFGDLLSSSCGIAVAIDDSDDSLELVLEDESDNGICCWVNLIRETVIFGEGVNAVELIDDELESVDEKLLTLLLVFAYKLIRLSLCTLFSTTRRAARSCCDNNETPLGQFSSSSSSSMCGSVNGKWLCTDEREVEETFVGEDDCCMLLDKLSLNVVSWLILRDDDSGSKGRSESFGDVSK